MPPERDLFANFERMRREMDELFGNVFERTGLATRGEGFAPKVDVYYLGDPPRELVITGHRTPADPEGQVYQQIEIEYGPFRRVIALGAEVVADDASAVYEDGVLRVELPLAQPGGTSRKVPIEIPREDGE